MTSTLLYLKFGQTLSTSLNPVFNAASFGSLGASKPGSKFGLPPIGNAILKD